MKAINDGSRTHKLRLLSRKMLTYTAFDYIYRIPVFFYLHYLRLL
jgi:hypothetical protein